MYCNQCGSGIPESARFCQACGTRVFDHQAERPQMPEPVTKEPFADSHPLSSLEQRGSTWRCASCRRLNRPGALVCSCGQPYGSHEDAVSPLASPKSVSASPRNTAPSIEPFLSIWVRPRATIRRIVDTNPTMHFFALVCLAAFFNSLNQASNRSVGDRMPTWAVLLMAAALSPLAIPLIYLLARLGRWTGAKLGGVASEKEVRAAVAWSNVPMIELSLIVWPLGLVLFGDEIFRTAAPSVDASPPALSVALLLVGVAILMWSSVVGIKCFAEVHRFSAWKAIGAGVMALGVALGLILAVAIVVVIVIALVSGF